MQSSHALFSQAVFLAICFIIQQNFNGSFISNILVKMGTADGWETQEIDINKSFQFFVVLS